LSERTLQPSESLRTPRWLHAWAVLTVCATVPLLFLGAEVTTKQVGMVDPVGFREPWHLAYNLERAFRELGYLIEHSHRLLGFMVGACAIVLALGLWLREPRRWVRWLGVAALAGVSLQGLLGILRVNQNVAMGRELALIHGCTAQLVFALLCSVALFTSRGWQTAQAGPDGSKPFRPWSILVAALVYLQVVLGAFVRHLNSPVAQRLHMLIAFAVIAAAIWLVKLIHDNQTAWPRFVPAIRWLGGLLVLQLVLGVEAWIQKYGAGPLPDLQPLTTGQEMVRTSHLLLGSAIFATTVMIALRAHRQASWNIGFVAVPVGRMEGVA
jgi:cytochrome c oxidase assembly protein subunit 15